MANEFKAKNGIITPKIESTVATGTAPLTVASTTKVTNLNADLVDGYSVAESNTASTIVARDSSNNISTTGIKFSKDVGTSTMTWNAAAGTFDLPLNNNTTLQVGQESHFYGKASSNVNNGQLVMFTGIDAGVATFAPANYSTYSSNPQLIMGVATNTITSGNYGYVTWFGQVHDLNTSAYASGDILYADPTIIGGLTNVSPAAPYEKIVVASVVDVNAITGVLLVRIDFGKLMSQLGDVGFTSLVDKNLIMWDAPNSKWINVAQSTIDAGTAVKLKTARTINGVSFDGTANITVTSNTTNALTIGTGLSGTSFNGSSPVTISIDSTVATLNGTQTLLNKSISGITNSLSNIPNSALTNSTININGSSIPLGGSVSNLALTTNKLSQFAATTSAELATVISDETGSGVLVFGTSPTFTDSIRSATTSFNLINTTSTTVNAFGAATAVSIGANTGYVSINNATDSVSTTTGGLLAAGGLGVVKNANIGGVLYVGQNAYSSALTAPILVARSSGTDYTQAALINTASTGSSDWAAYADNGTEVAGWADMGVTGSNFSDASYTITGKNDGYFFVKPVTGTGLQGNMVLATSGNGTMNDIVFATGGFLSSNEKMRYNHAIGQFDIQPTTASTSTTTGALRVRGGAGIAGNLNVGGIINVGATTINSGITTTNIIASGDVAVNGGDITSTASTFNIVDTGVSTINIGSAANAINIGSSTSTVTVRQNLVVTANLSVLGNVVTINSSDTNYTDAIIDLHNTSDNSPLVLDDGKDVGFKFHYFKTSDKIAALVWGNDTGYLEYYGDGQETAGVFTGQYGTIKSGSLYATANVKINGSTSGTTTIVSPAVANSNVITLPSSTDVLVGRATTDTLTNKTLTSPVISTITNVGTLTLPTSTDTLVGKATTDTLTNKTFDTSATGNVLKINNVGITDVTGTGKVVLQTSPSLITPSVNGSGMYYNGSTSGTTTLKASASAGSTTITLPAVTGTVVTTGDIGSITAAMLAGSIPNSKLTNSSVTIGSTAISLGASSTTLTGLTSVTSTTFVGSLTGNADSVTNGVYTTGSYSDPSWLTLSKSKVGLSNVENTALSTWAGTSNITTVGTISSGTWSGLFGAVSGANLTNITAGNLTGTIPSAVLGNSTHYIGTTAVALNRASANQALTGISSITLPGSTSGTVVLQPSAISGTSTLTLPATTGTLAVVSDIKDATLTLSMGIAGASNSTVTVANGTGFSANGSTNTTYQLSVGPSLTNLATIMSNGTNGLVKKTGIDTYSIDTTAYLTSSTGVSSFSGGTTGLTPNTATTGAITLGGTLAITNGGTGQTTKTAAFDALSPLSTLGDLIYHDGTDNVRLAGNITTTKQFLRQTGTGTGSAIPAWDTVTKTDVGLSNVDNTADVNKNVLSATKFTTARTIGMTGDVTWSSGSFDGSANVTAAATLANSGVTAGTYTKVTVDAKGRATSGTTLSASDIPVLDASKITTGVFDAARLPSYVDDVLEYANLAAFPVTGETGKIYVALDSNKVYRWSGSVYVYITSGAVDSVAGKTGVVTLVKGDVGLGNVENTALSTWAGSANITTVGTIGTGTWNGTTIAVANGGTGATTAATARTNLGLAIGSNVQAWDSDLDSIAGLAGTNGLLKKTAANTWSLDTNTYLTSSTGVSSFSGGTTGLTPNTATNGAITLGGTLAIANGGTGATTASAALTSLGAYAATNPNGYTSNTGTVTSVGGTGTVSGLSLSGTVTTSGNLTLGGTLAVTASNFASQTANTVLAAPNGTAGVPTFRAIVAADIPVLDASKITTGVFDAARLPSYVDDVLEYTNLASFPVTGETGKIYVDLATNKTYRWSGTVYVYITSGAVDSVAGKTGVVTLVKADVGLGSVENTALSTWAGSANITTVGTIGTGTWNATTIGTAKGGTGLTSFNLNGAVYATSTSALTTGTLPIASGGTGATTAAAALTSLGAYSATNPSGYTANTGTVTSVAALTIGTTGTDVSSTVATGTTTPVITLNIPTASATNRGALSSTDWTTFNNKTSNTGTVTSVGGTGTVSGLTLTGTVTTTGNLTLGGTLAVTASNFASQTADTVLAAPQGANGVPTFRNIHLSDMPSAWIKRACNAATTAALTINTAQTAIDGVTLSATSRVLVKNQATPAQNGIYTNVTTTAWTRATDADAAGDIAGAFVNVDAGTVNGGKVFDTDFKSTDTLGTTAMSWYQNVDTGMALTSGSTVVDGYIRYAGTTATAGQFDGGTTTPTGTTRLNYGGYFYPSYVNLVGSADTTTAATHYFVETGTDGYVRPKPLANVQAELVTSAAVIAGLGFTPYSSANPSGFITSSASITGNAATATTLQTARTLTIGTTSKTFNGSADVSWTLAEIGAYSSANPSGFITSSASITGNAATATNKSGGVANQILYQSAASTTAFIAAPTVASTTLTWNGTSFVWAAAAGGITIADDTSTNATRYIMFDDITSGSASTVNVSSTKLYFNPSTGVLSSTAFNSLSDITLKENIVPLTASIDEIEPVEFTWKDNGIKSFGVIAQQIEDIFPHLVETNSAGIKSVSYIQMIPILIKEILDLKNEVKLLKSK